MESRSSITLQMLVGAAERLQRREDAHSRKLEDWMSLVEDTRDRLLKGPFEALPLDGFVRSDDPKRRVLTVARPGRPEWADLARLTNVQSPHNL